MAAWVEAARSALAVDPGRLQLIAQLLRLRQHGRLQARKRKVEVAAVQQRPRQLERGRVALLRQPRQGRPARVAEAHQLGGFVEGLARGVVDGLAQDGVAPHPVHPHQLGVSARDKQRDKREFRRVRAQEWRQQVALQVVHAQHWPLQRCAQRAGHARSDQQRAGQPRPPRESDHVHVRQSATGIPQHQFGQRQHATNMVTAGQLGHHTAVSLVHVDLAEQGV
jgi:hypothetical protein